ncbi:MAG: PrsW family intramembrane metalloprotease, partial [Romboutsia sp.]|nr:PrsW family intramembrane metalloprotease [Romboutsia sp.]
MKIEILILAISPIIACIFWIYLKDKYDKEPTSALTKYFCLGILTSFICIIVENLLQRLYSSQGISFILYTSFIVAGLAEELIKAIILIPNLTREKYFNEKLDGIIYSVFLSLGFATIENIIYIVHESYEYVFQLGLSRAIISVPAHIMFGITMGYYIGKFKFEKNKNKKLKYIFMSIFIPALLHGIFDFILMIRYKW